MRPSWNKWLSSSLLIAWLPIVSTTATMTHVSRADHPRAEELIRRGLEARRNQQDLEALELFRQAHAVEPSARTNAQIGLALQALGRWLEAESVLDTVVRESDDWVVAHRVTLQSALATIQTHLGWLQVYSSAQGAELWLDNERKGTLPLASMRITAGTHVCELRTKQGVTLTRSVSVRGGEHWALELEPPKVATPSSSAPRTITSAQPTHSMPPPRVVTKIDVRRTLAYGAAATASLSLLNAVVALIVRDRAVDRYNSPSCYPNRSEQCASDRSTMQAAEVVAGVGFGLAGAFAISSALLFAKSSTPSSTSVGVTTTPDSAGFLFRTTF